MMQENTPTNHCSKCEVRELLSRYAVALDTKDQALLESCFTPDVRVKYQLSHLESELQIDGVLDLARGLGEFDRTTHLVGTVLTRFEGDEAHVHSYSTAYLIGRDDSGPFLLTRAVQYRDQMRRFDGEWRIHRRTHSVSWETQSRVVLDPDLPACDGYGLTAAKVG